MSLVAVENLKEGWILCEDVRDDNGRLMLSKGRKIESNHIKTFKIWGISEVRIKENYQPPPPDQGDKDIQKLLNAEQTAQMVMQNMDANHPGIKEIFHAAVKYRYQHNLITDYDPPQALPPNFKLDLSSGLGAQIEFGDIKLPDAPDIILDFNKVIEDPVSSIHNIADVVQRSPSLTSLLLKLANSAFYGFPSRIDTISRAVAVIGTREIHSLILGINVMRQFHDISKDLADMTAFIKHSLSCGILCRILAANAKRQYTERLFVAGLLHDIGRLIWYKYFPEQAKLILKMASKTGCSLYEIENRCLGISHEEIAAHLLKKWNFPVSLKNSLIHHHRPSESADSIEASIVHIADITVNAIGLGHSGERIIPRFEPGAWDLIQISPSGLKRAIEQTLEQLVIMEAFFSE